MQIGFEKADQPHLLRNVQTEIRRTIRSKGAVLFLEYDGFGPTFGTLHYETRNYFRFSIIKKKQDDGSKEVLQEIDRQKFPANTLRVVGVNWDVCVTETAIGLATKLRDGKVCLVRKACAGYNNNLRWTKNYGNIEVEL